MVSTALDQAMQDLQVTNVAVATRCGVTEKTVRDWRLADEKSKEIPYWAVLELPDMLRRKMLSVGDGFVMAESIARMGAK